MANPPRAICEFCEVVLHNRREIRAHKRSPEHRAKVREYYRQENQ